MRLRRVSSWQLAVGSCVIGAAVALACSAEPTPSPISVPAAPSALVPEPEPEPVLVPAVASASASASASAPAPAPACPSGMQHIQTSYCPEMKRECVKKEYDKPNRITICHHFREGKNDCQAPRQPLDYCIDDYEYPNQAGQKPPVMVSFFDAEKSCADAGKRVCRESEWVAACEGPDETPFPYGWRREPEKCNFDNKWINPILDRVYSKDPEVQRAELLRLDRSLPSGARPDCKSGFGVFDLTGNVDEWVRADDERSNRRSRFAGLKGGAWGHVRNACRPVTTSHPPEFTYYFISFRCCADAVD
jgi:formylglycine-generating enzyme